MSDGLLNKVAGRVRLMVGRAILAALDDGTKFQSLQVELLSGEVREKVERFQDYGFTSVPFPGAEGVALSVGGSRDHVVIVALGDRRFRLTSLAAGEVAMYTDEGDKIVMHRGNRIEVTAATEVRLVTPLTTITGNLHVMGNQVNAGRIDATGDVTGQGKSLPTHTHQAQGAFDVTTPPLG